MKSLLVLLFLGIIKHASSDKMEFIDNNWQKASSQAKQDSKYLFVDCYTDWCYWCKVMERQTFNKDEVAKTMNKYFVPLKMNMQYAFGKKIAMKFRVLSYPTYLIFNSDGKLIYRAAGYYEAVDFLTKLEDALDPAKQITAPGISDKIDLDFPDFYKQAFGTENKIPDSLILTTYLNQQQDLMNEVNFDVLYHFAHSLSPKYKQYILNNSAKYAALYTQDAVDEVIKSFANQKEEMGMSWQQFASKADTILTHTGYSNYGEINEWAGAVYEKCNDQAIIKKAIGWLKPVIDARPKYSSMYIFAALLFKAERYNGAETYARKAMELGKQEGENTDNTEYLLTEIRKKKKAPCCPKPVAKHLRKADF